MPQQYSSAYSKTEIMEQRRSRPTRKHLTSCETESVKPKSSVLQFCSETPVQPRNTVLHSTSGTSVNPRSTVQQVSPETAVQPINTVLHSSSDTSVNPRSTRLPSKTSVKPSISAKENYSRGPDVSSEESKREIIPHKLFFLAEMPSLPIGYFLEKFNLEHF